MNRFRSSRPEVFCKKGVLRNFAKFTGKHLCQSLFFNKVAGLWPLACNFIKKEILAQVFSREFCKISKNTFFTEHLWTTASAALTFMTYNCSLKTHFKDLNNIRGTVKCITRMNSSHLLADLDLGILKKFCF